METIIFGQWWSHQSIEREGSRIFRFCTMLWKDEREPNIKFCLGTAVGLVQRFITVQNFGQLTENRWNSSGIFPTIHHIAAVLQSPRVHVEYEHRAGRFRGSDYLHVDVQRHFLGSEESERECELFARLVSMYTRGFSPGKCSFLGPASEKEWYSTHEYKPHKEWDRVAEQMMMELSENGHPVFRATSPLSLTRERLKLFFAQIFLLISAVFTEQSQICVKNAKPAMLEQGDLLWWDNLTHCLCQVWWRHTLFWPMILRKKIYCQEIRNELKGYQNKIVWLNFVLMQDSWQRLRSDSASWQKTLTNSHNLQMQWLVVSTFCQEIENHLTRKVGFERTPRLDPGWKSQPATCKVYMIGN